MKLRWPERPTVGPFRDDAFSGRLHDERTAAVLGIALGVGFAVCFATGLLSHLIQNPPGWFLWTSRPAGLYRLTQGTHVAVGLALIPVLLAKLWVVYPKFFEWPPFESFAHFVERISILPLVGGGLFLSFTGLGNINVWRPWNFGFRPGHYWAAWITIGALVVHVFAKYATTRDALWRSGVQPAPALTIGAPSADGQHGMSRRSFFATTFGASAAVALFTVGQSFEPLQKVAYLAPRRPDSGPQGLPVNRTAAEVGLTDVSTDDYRLVVDGSTATTPFELTYDELRAMPQRTVELPIACVEGWSATATWTGVPVTDLLARAGAPDDCEARATSMQDSPRQRSSDLNRLHAHDRDTLLALAVNGEVLDADHGFPVRLIGPNRPGVMQTKWVNRLEAR